MEVQKQCEIWEPVVRVLRKRFCKISNGKLLLGLWAKVNGSLRIQKIMWLFVIPGEFPQVYWFSGWAVLQNFLAKSGDCKFASVCWIGACWSAFLAGLALVVDYALDCFAWARLVCFWRVYGAAELLLFCKFELPGVDFWVIRFLKKLVCFACGLYRRFFLCESA